MHRLTSIRTVFWVLFGAVFVTVVSVWAAVAFDPGVPLFHMDHRYADAIRILILAEIAFAFGQTLQMVADFRSVEIDDRDLLIVPMACHAAWTFILSLYVALDVVDRLGMNGVTYRGVLALVAMLFGIASIILMRRRMNMALSGVRAVGGTAKVTITETSRPGPDVDMMHGGDVVAKTDAEK